MRSGAAMLANSHSSRRVSRGSMISSTQKLSAVRNGERSRFSRASIFSRFARGPGCGCGTAARSPGVGRVPGLGR
jgi:hypothetical protein